MSEEFTGKAGTGDPDVLAVMFGTKPVHPGGNEPSSMSTAFRNSNVDVDTNPTTLNITPIAATINPWGRIGNK